MDMKSLWKKLTAENHPARNSDNFSFWFISLIYMETLLHGLLLGSFEITFLFTIGYTVVIAMVISGLLGMLPGKANCIISCLLMTLICLVFCSQLVYGYVFGSLYSVSMMGLGADAITNFWRETLRTIVEHLPQLLAMLLPIPVSIVLALKSKRLFHLTRNIYRPLTMVLALILQLSLYQYLSIGGTDIYSNYYFYHSNNTTTDQSAHRFGLLTTIRLELFAQGQESTDDDLQLSIPVQHQTNSSKNPGSTTADSDIVYNVLNIDFDYLNTLTEDRRLLRINDYVKALSPTATNEYTGMLSDYNLITICAESFASGAIDPELTPTLYKLSTEGIVFNNYYNSYPNVTTDGEYSFCFGLWPDTSRTKSTASFYATRNSYLPFALGNVFAEQAGITAYSYHNYLGSFYGRDESHPNLGYICKFMDDGMTFTYNWPSSDLEMMQQSVADYITADSQFHAYYMTFSGHYKYDQNNPIARQNYHYVKNLSYSEEAKCYLSCNYELERALAYLMEQLEAAGVADKTAIVLAGDHFPYGLTDMQYSELVGYTIDDFSKYKSTLIFWVGGLEAPIYVDEYMCNIDILPTILNLWGFNYDSRLLAGTDVFSDGQHIAVLRDRSFLTDRVWYNASTGEIVWLGEEDRDYLKAMGQLVQNQFALSELILNKAYYNFLFEKGNVTIDNSSWHPDAQENTTVPPTP